MALLSRQQTVRRRQAQGPGCCAAVVGCLSMCADSSPATNAMVRRAAPPSLAVLCSASRQFAGGQGEGRRAAPPSLAVLCRASRQFAGGRGKGRRAAPPSLAVLCRASRQFAGRRASVGGDGGPLVLFVAGLPVVGLLKIGQLRRPASALRPLVAGCPSAVGAVAGFGRQSGVDHRAGPPCAPSTTFVFAPARTNMVHGTQRSADGPTDRLKSSPKSQRSQVRAVVDNPSTAKDRPATNARPGVPRRRSWPLFEVRRRFPGGAPEPRSAAPP